MFWCDSMSMTLDLPDFQGIDLVVKIYMGLQLRSIAQTDFDEVLMKAAFVYINFNKSLDCVLIKTRLISDMICFMFVQLDCSCACPMACHY